MATPENIMQFLQKLRNDVDLLLAKSNARQPVDSNSVQEVKTTKRKAPTELSNDDDQQINLKSQPKRKKTTTTNVSGHDDSKSATTKSSFEDDTLACFTQGYVKNNEGNKVQVLNEHKHLTEIIYRIYNNHDGTKTQKLVWLKSDKRKKRENPIAIYHEDSDNFYIEKWGSGGECYGVNDVQFKTCIGYQHDGVFHPKEHNERDVDSGFQETKIETD